ncbi:hypothetical protein RRG08_022383 [Elysia crispata]|uniref:Uncharacterized protein n=1 Tax=Elysia crispata TaxID=231223 RepID=A0AAE0Z2K3_9GAST|nr:hypothetical protein RRG08_022383 [Elysia crispata]
MNKGRWLSCRALWSREQLTGASPVQRGGSGANQSAQATLQAVEKQVPNSSLVAGDHEGSGRSAGLPVTLRCSGR